MKIKALLIATALATMPAAASAKVYDVTTGFNGGTGGFVFGSGTAGVTFTPFTANYTGGCFGQAALACKSDGGNGVVPVAGLNQAATPTGFVGTVLVPAGALFLHPGADAGQDAIAEFIAPSSANYSFSGAFTRYSTVNGGDGIVGSVSANGVTLFSTTISNGSGYGATSAFGGPVHLNAGDRLTFAVNRNGEYTYDSTGLAASVSVVPEPALWGMMILGFGAIGGVMRRRGVVASAAIA